MGEPSVVSFYDRGEDHPDQFHIVINLQEILERHARSDEERKELTKKVYRFVNILVTLLTDALAPDQFLCRLKSSGAGLKFIREIIQQIYDRNVEDGDSEEDIDPE